MYHVIKKEHILIVTKMLQFPCLISNPHYTFMYWGNDKRITHSLLLPYKLYICSTSKIHLTFQALVQWTISRNSVQNNVKFECRKIAAIKAFPMSYAFGHCIQWKITHDDDGTGWHTLLSSPWNHMFRHVTSASCLALYLLWCTARRQLCHLPVSPSSSACSKASHINHSAYTSQKVRLSAIFKCLYCYPHYRRSVRLMPFYDTLTLSA